MNLSLDVCLGYVLMTNNISIQPAILNMKWVYNTCIALYKLCVIGNLESPISYILMHDTCSKQLLGILWDICHKMGIEQVKCFFTIFLLILFFALFGYESVIKE